MDEGVRSTDIVVLLTAQRVRPRGARRAGETDLRCSERLSTPPRFDPHFCSSPCARICGPIDPNARKTSLVISSIELSPDGNRKIVGPCSDVGGTTPAKAFRYRSRNRRLSRRVPKVDPPQPDEERLVRVVPGSLAAAELRGRRDHRQGCTTMTRMQFAGSIAARTCARSLRRIPTSMSNTRGATTPNLSIGGWKTPCTLEPPTALATPVSTSTSWGWALLVNSLTLAHQVPDSLPLTA
jgi:hypothetical protein